MDATEGRYVVGPDGGVRLTLYSAVFGGRSRTGLDGDGDYAAVDVSRWEQASDSDRFRWSQGVSVGEMERAFGIDDIDAIEVVGRADGYPTAVEVQGIDDGQQVTRTLDPYDDVRNRLGLLSPRFAIHTLRDLGDDEQVAVRRVSGDTRIATAIELSQDGWSGGSDTVVLAREDDSADALTASTLAGPRDAPMLLTAKAGLSEAVAVELERLGADTAFLVGGTGALAPQVARDVRALGITTRRVEGSSRHGTAVDVARRVGGGDHRTAYLAHLRDGWPDALSVAGVAARRAADGDAWPILGTEDTLPAETRAGLDELGITRVVPLGGTVAIPNGVLRQLRDLGIQIADRLAGPTRYATSRAIAATDTPPNQTLTIATGEKFPDGLAAGPWAARVGGALLLVPSELDRSDSPGRPSQHPTYLDWLGWNSPELVAVGGTGALSNDVVAHTADVLRP